MSPQTGAALLVNVLLLVLLFAGLSQVVQSAQTYTREDVQRMYTQLLILQRRIAREPPGFVPARGRRITQDIITFDEQKDSRTPE